MRAPSHHLAHSSRSHTRSGRPHALQDARPWLEDNLASHTMEPLRSMLGCPSGMLLCKRGGLIRECHRLRDATDAALAMRGSIPPVDGGQISQSWADASDCTGVLLHIPHS